jgi:hypothetical protein
MFMAANRTVLTSRAGQSTDRRSPGEG